MATLIFDSQYKLLLIPIPVIYVTMAELLSFTLAGCFGLQVQTGLETVPEGNVPSYWKQKVYSIVMIF